MARLFMVIVATFPFAFAVGCGKAAPSTAPRPLPTASTPSQKPLPAEYRTLAENVGMEIKKSVEEFRDNKGIAEIIAEGHEAVMALQGIESSDRDISYIAEQGQSGTLMR